jgi:hypothetical protein
LGTGIGVRSGGGHVQRAGPWRWTSIRKIERDRGGSGQWNTRPYRPLAGCLPRTTCRYADDCEPDTEDRDQDL